MAICSEKTQFWSPRLNDKLIICRHFGKGSKNVLFDRMCFSNGKIQLYDFLFA